MAKKNATIAIAEELQNPAFIPFLEEWIKAQLALGLQKQDADRIIALGRLRDLVNKAKG